jgi:hypothetical protein
MNDEAKNSQRGKSGLERYSRSARIEIDIFAMPSPIQLHPHTTDRPSGFIANWVILDQIPPTPIVTVRDSSGRNIIKIDGQIWSLI